MQTDQQAVKWSIRTAETILTRYPLLAQKWAYEWGVTLKGIEQVWLATQDERYLTYIKHNLEAFIQPDGEIRTYRLDEYNLDQINLGKLLFGMRRASGDQRYEQAAHWLRRQLRTHPRTASGGFWHKQIYPYQMWLDGLYMAAPFYAEYARTFGEPQAFDDIAHQIDLLASHTRDAQTGLLYHGWDESKNQRWANPQTGCSPNFWGRAIGWFVMAIPDILDHFPASHPKREAILSVFQEALAAVVRVQDEQTGLWYQVLDQGNRAGNYLEASASCMFVYALAKGLRKGYLNESYCGPASRGYEGILSHFVETEELGQVNVKGICSVAGLGGSPYRDGSYDYYINEPVVANDHKGIGAFILASAEMEQAHLHD